MKKWFSTALMVFLLSISAPRVFSQSEETQLTGTTRTLINLRSGPGTGFGVLEILPAQLTVTFVGRNQSGTWLLVNVDSLQGWLSYTYVSINGDINTLPISNTSGTTNPAASEVTTDSVPVAAPSGVVPQISRNVRRIFLRGQELGNRADVFSKVGDSITASDLFLDQVGHGGYVLQDYEYLHPVIEYFSQTAARDHFSFANTSLAARGGWTSADLLNPSRSTPGICQSGESPLVCEYRVVQPSIALIMIGTNDVPNVRLADFGANLQTIVQTSIDRGVIPVLSTIPDQPGTPYGDRVSEFNRVIMAIAQSNDVPLWNLWEALQPLPNQGISSDHMHPSNNPMSPETAVFTPEGLRYGYNMRNLTALMVLDAIWRGAMFD